MSNLSDSLLFWYEENKRKLPWRRIKDLNNPYFIWISEIMLQQTNVNTVIRYYKQFIKKWPTIEKLANAKLDDVLFIWQGLGYYNRAINAHKSAKIICKDFNGKFPSSTERLLKLPGVGKYTANAICSIAFNKRTIGIDVNVKRVISRIFNLDINDEKKIEKTCLEVLPYRNNADFMQAIMDVGSSICTKKKINCSICPLIKDCNYKIPKNDQKTLFKKKYKRRFSYIYLMQWKNKIFLKKRNKTKLLNGLMEIPGTEWSESKLSTNIAKTIAPVKLNWKVVPGTLAYNISNCKLEVNFLRAKINRKINIKNGKWIKQNKIQDLPLSTLTKKILDRLSLS